MKSASVQGAYPTVSSPRQNTLSQVVQMLLVFVGLLILSPLFLMLALAVRLTSPGPIFYRGQRVGKDQKIFFIRKFRTLVVNAEQKIGARLLKEEDQLYTPIGKFLKKTKLDELPQLLNVLSGDMDLVGPRPVRPIFLEQLKREVPRYTARFRVRPGMTGLAQVYGGYWTDPRNKLRYELIYIHNQSLLFDLKLIWLTLLKIGTRLVTTGMLLWVFFLFVSFFPSSLYPWLYATLGGIKVNLLHLAIAGTAAWVIGQRTYAHRMYLYRSSVYLPMIGFTVSGLISAWFSPASETAMRGAIYYLVTGFFFVLGPQNTKLSSGFIRSVATVISFACGILALVGLGELALMKHSLLATTVMSSSGETTFWTMKATFANANVLAAYLVLGFPLLLCQLMHARTRDARDFWLVSTTIVFTSILLTQDLLGLFALFVTCAVFLAYTSSRTIPLLVCLFLAPLLLLGAWDQSATLSRQMTLLQSGTGKIVRELLTMPSPTLLIGSGIKTRQLQLGLRSEPTSSAVESALSTDEVSNNMHWTLIRETGLIGWLLMLWIIGATLRTLYWGTRHAEDPYHRTLLWALCSSILGFLISMCGLDAFFHLPLQVLFWGIVGLGLGTVTHVVSNRSPFYVIWRFGDDRPRKQRPQPAVSAFSPSAQTPVTELSLAVSSSLSAKSETPA
ncbi:MAG: sugar transferase [Deltaproteobacteria bacterium]|nr:sugar transferase [Deltaproteobacteria bacterium]